jgi:tetratricopeptide (TPR) repeat protein
MSTPAEITLRIVTAAESSGLGFTMELVESGHPALYAAGTLIPQLAKKLSADLQWYLEKFLDERDEAALVRAKNIRESIKVSGKGLFQGLFQANADARVIWRRIAPRLSHTRIEIVESAEHSGILWELLRDPTTNMPVCLSAATFVRSYRAGSSSGSVRLTKLKVLLVISRPDGTSDVELRTIASSIYSSLRASSRFQVDVLRPPTYEALEHTLHEAAEQNDPYDLVHFDGHGFYQSPSITDSGEEYGGGYLVFEHDSSEHGDPISGEAFGSLANECGVRTVVLNACRSAYQGSADDDTNNLDRPTSSFAHAVLAAGVPTVVAMSFNVYVTSAKTFMEEFYRQLQQGQALGVAASLARKHLSIDQARFHQDISDIDDWLVPVIYQYDADLKVELSEVEPKTHRRVLPQSFPLAPDFGFVGSDDAILQIDRSFDSHNIVLLFGLAGAGKSAASVEFSTWYQETNAETKTLVFASFETSPSLAEVLAIAEPAIGTRVRALDLMDATVQDSIVRKLARKGTLWVWDNVETVTAMDATEQKRFAQFIQRANNGGLKILLTARDEQKMWLDDAIHRVEMPALRPSEAVEFAKRILAHRKIKKFSPGLWTSLIDFAAGNPLTLRVAISSYLNTTRKPTETSIASYVRDLRHGVAQLGDGAGSDRARSLTASLNYGFERAFDVKAMRVLSLLSLFRTYVNSSTVQLMCRPITDKKAVGMPDHDLSWTIPGLEEETQVSIEVVLDKAVELGVLRKSEDHNYWLHPAIHLHLQPFFEKSYPTPEQRAVAGRAYAEAQGLFGIQFTRVLQKGARAKVLEALTKDAGNFEQGLFAAHANGWKQAEIGILHGLNALLVHQGRFEQWRVVFSEVWEDFIGPDMEPLPGCELWWSFIMDHRLRIALEDQDVEAGEPIALLVKAHEGRQTAGIPRKPGFQYNEAQRRALNDLAIATGRLADVLRQKEDTKCVALNEEAIALYELIGEKTPIAIRELNLGHCYKNVPSIRDLEAAEKHYRLAIDNYPENDALARSQAVAQISMTWLDAIRERGEDKPLPQKLKEKLAETIEQYEKAFEGLPADAWGHLANLHNNLADALRLDPDRRNEAPDHFRLAHKYAVAVGRYDEAAVFRANLAQLFAVSNRPEEASAAAEQALQELHDLGMDDAEVIPILRRIIKRGS